MIKLIVHIFTSKPDRNGNVETAFTATDAKTGKVIFAVTACEDNVRAMAHDWEGKGTGWDKGIIFNQSELPIREYNRMVKDEPYAGCNAEDVRAYIKEKLGMV